MLERDCGQRGDPRRPLVKAGNGVEFGAACPEEGRLSFDTDLLQGLEAIGHEPRADDVDPADAFTGELDQGRGGVGLEPSAAAEARLEGDRVLLGTQPQLGGHQARGLPALAVIRVAQLQRAPRQAVERQHELVRTTVFHPVVVDALHQCRDGEMLQGLRRRT